MYFVISIIIYTACVIVPLLNSYNELLVMESDNPVRRNSNNITINLRHPAAASTLIDSQKSNEQKCYGIIPISRPNKLNTKYVVWYPRAGMGNILVSYASAVMYGCLTGRILKIAPHALREKDVFNCREYFDENMSGSICQDLEMDMGLTLKYLQSNIAVKHPEAWEVSQCPSFKQHLEYFLCDNGYSEEELIAVSSCQYWADLFFSNPHFKDRIPSNAFRDIVRDRLAPSAAVRKKMVQDVYQVCVHIRFDVGATKFDLGNDWMNNLASCIRNIFSRNQDNTHDAKNEVLLFTMHKDVRDIVKRSLETGNKPYSVRFASETNSVGSLALASDEYSGVASMFSMAKCVNLLPSKESSTYFMIGANLLDNIRIFPGSSWADGCLEGTEITELNPSGDFWNEGKGIGGGNGDVCKLRDVECSGDAAVTKRPIHDDKCKNTFEWPMLNHWQSFDVQHLQQTKILKLPRMGGLYAEGTSDMMITIRNSHLNITVIDTTGHISNLKDKDNLWHRHAAMYGAWVGSLVANQVAQQHFGMFTDQTVYVHDCTNEPYPIEWQSLGELSCNTSLIDEANVVVLPPLEGLMWDLAWDFHFECENSDMFKTYAGLYSDRTIELEPTEATGCWISRKGASVRTVKNLDDILKLMREIFPRALVIEFAPDKTTRETAYMIRECRVLFGVHGAGHTNALYARPGVSVVEIIGKDRPAYFRNLNMLLGHHYQSVVGDPTKDRFADKYNINLKEARDALMKARDHAADWIDRHGHW